MTNRQAFMEALRRCRLSERERRAAADTLRHGTDEEIEHLRADVFAAAAEEGR